MTVVSPHTAPTSQLPPIGKIKTCSIEELIISIRYLRLLYTPEVRGTRRIGQYPVFPRPTEIESTTNILSQHQTKYNSHDTLTSAEQSLHAINFDEFERSYAIRWLTALVSQADQLLSCTDSSLQDNPVLESQAVEWENMIENAAALLATCAGTASAGTVSRVFVFPYGANPLMRVQIRDAPLENHDFHSVGAQTWGSACLLAEMMVDSPDLFGLSNTPHTRPLRVLELGAGTGLVTLTASLLLHGFGADQFTAKVDVVATDFHPSVLENLRYNVADNISATNVQVHFLDWSQFPLSPSSAPFNNPFDIIFGADIIYEAEHAKWIRNCLRLLLRKPDGRQAESRFHLVIPLRPTHPMESQAIDLLFPTGSPFQPPPNGISVQTIPILGIIRKDVIVCGSGANVCSRASDSDLVEYAHYTIAWIDPPISDTNNAITLRHHTVSD
ncbi:unnamed protein product [Somion occarium]|uniref:S-adenosyl-L-methionine-dependent methyltransferase n=1 Tax=Somion occarium TaxID=3059160 RepID=A0ABP1DRQ8_9APHY